MTTLDQYLNSAMERARYKVIPDDGTYFGEIPGFRGVWSNEDTLGECRIVLREVLEGWLQLKVKDNDDNVPVVSGIVLTREHFTTKGATS